MNSTQLSAARAADDVPDASAGRPAWTMLVVLVTLLTLGIVVSVVGSWIYHNSPAAKAERYANEWADENRAFLVSESWAHIDAATGLVVAKLATRINCYRADPEVEQSPAIHGDQALVSAAWNETTRRRIDETPACAPRFRDRITTLDAVRERFRADSASAVPLDRFREAPVGDALVRWWGSQVIVRDVGAKTYRQPIGGGPVEPEIDRNEVDVSVQVLLIEEGRTLLVRIASPTGTDLYYMVVDIATGTHLYVFPVPA